MTTVIIGIAALTVLALAGWAVAEGKYKADAYQSTEAEKAAEEKTRENQLRQERELGIKDVIRTISAKGFSAV